MDNCWNTDIDETIVKPIAEKAIKLYGEEFIKQESTSVDYELDGYKINMIKNPVLHNIVYEILFPHTKKAEYMINVEVNIKGRWFVGICYKMKDGSWIEDSRLKKLTTYEGN